MEVRCGSGERMMHEDGLGVWRREREREGTRI